MGSVPSFRRRSPYDRFSLRNVQRFVQVTEIDQLSTVSGTAAFRTQFRLNLLQGRKAARPQGRFEP
jgi:hypothetical protein